MRKYYMYFFHTMQVVPRQTCQLYTHTYSNVTFKGGREQLVSSALGGTVFNTLLFNPVSLQLDQEDIIIHVHVHVHVSSVIAKHFWVGSKIYIIFTMHLLVVLVHAIVLAFFGQMEHSQCTD